MQTTDLVKNTCLGMHITSNFGALNDYRPQTRTHVYSVWLFGAEQTIR